MLLAIDTATRAISLALHDGQRLFAEQTWQTANNHTTELAPTIQQLLARCEFAISDLTAIAVSVGPGSFTGLRIGVSLAKGLASAQQIPLVGVTTLDILAAGQPAYPGHDLLCIVEAGRGRIIAARYLWIQDGWAQSSEAQLMNWEQLLATITDPVYLTGDIDTTGREILTTAMLEAGTVKLALAASRLRRAGYLAEVALERLRTQDAAAFAPMLLIPQYVKTRDIP